jgi:hypothetical protein
MAITTWIEIEVLISLVNLRTSSTHPISMDSSLLSAERPVVSGPENLAHVQGLPTKAHLMIFLGVVDGVFGIYGDICPCQKGFTTEARIGPRPQARSKSSPLSSISLT